MNDSPAKTLPKAIDDLLAFVDSFVESLRFDDGEIIKSNNYLIPRSEMQERFRELDQRVFVLAHEAGLCGAFRPQHELERPLDQELNGKKLQPVQFEGRTNLPGDWSPDYFWAFPKESGWKDALLALRVIAESRSTPKGRRPGKPSKEETPAETKIIGALKTLLQDEDHPCEVPPKGREVASMAAVSPNTVKTFMKKHFGSQRQFEGAWQRDDVRLKLARIEYVPEPHREYDDERPPISSYQDDD